MPLTLPTHPLAVAPLKLWRPRWFDGVGLVLGTVAPDLAYAADGYGVTIQVLNDSAGRLSNNRGTLSVTVEEM